MNFKEIIVSYHWILTNEVRYESICARLKRIEQIMIAAAGFIVASLLAIAVKIH